MKDGGRCRYCGIEGPCGVDKMYVLLSIAYAILAYLCLACFWCNSWKQRYTVEENLVRAKRVKEKWGPTFMAM